MLIVVNLIKVWLTLLGVVPTLGVMLLAVERFSVANSGEGKVLLLVFRVELHDLVNDILSAIENR